MQSIDVLREILEWSRTRPDWQRDALRRLVTKGVLDESDLEDLTRLCKGAHGLGEKYESVPLGGQHLPTRGPGLDTVTLAAVVHHHGVNALATDQRLEFGPGLTIVYGANAAGKSGFTRILKRACRARGAEDILGNVLADSAPGRPSATIVFKLGEQEHRFSWKDEETHEVLAHVSVFDSHCAAVYLKEKTDVAFRPFGLDLFDKLSDACEAVRRTLEQERREIESAKASFPEFPAGTAAHKVVSSLSSLTSSEELKKMATLSDQERERLQEARKRLKDLETENPQRASQVLTLRAQRIKSLGDHLTNIEEAISDHALTSAFRARIHLRDAMRAAETLQTATFTPDLLPGTGLNKWRELWEAARRFSTEDAYPEHEFPFTGGEARCVLCQQTLDEISSARLRRFEEALTTSIQQDVDRAREAYDAHVKGLTSLAIYNDAARVGIEELRVEAEDLAVSVNGYLAQIQVRLAETLKALRETPSLRPDFPPQASLLNEVSKIAASLHDRANHLLHDTNKETKNALLSELQEFESRELLGTHLDAMLEEIERRKVLAAYQVCLQDTTTNAVTRKSTELTTRAVTQQLSGSFNQELRRLRFTHLEVQMQPAGGSRGTHYHKLVLKRAPAIGLPRVLSEGEARCLSFAAFFAELSTASDRSAILFDDPVSSLDHEWREHVARRLAEEAKNRQVVVFTHDIVFLHALVRLANEVGAQCYHQYLRREFLGAGVSSPELPWVAMKLKDRIGVLKNTLQRAEKLHRTATREEYEREVLLIYGRLREAWERGLEEVLLGGVVERYRPSIQTQQAKNLADITPEDCQALEAGMTKSSRWLPGHDQSPAENTPIPDPEELKADIDALEAWMKTIVKRRN